MSKSITFSVRINSDIKEECESLFNQLGVNLTTAINVFLRQSLQAGGFPFDVRLNTPNSTTVRAIKESQELLNNPNIKRYKDIDELFDDLQKE